MYPLGSGVIERRREREIKGIKLQEAVKTDADIKAKALWETNAEKKLAAKGVTSIDFLSCSGSLMDAGKYLGAIYCSSF